MADTRVTGLTALTAANTDKANDVVPIADVSASATKKITPQALLDCIASQAKGKLYVSDGTNMTALTVGSDNQVLTADSAQTTGVKWATASGLSKAHPFFKVSGSNGDEFLNCRYGMITVLGTISTTTMHTYTKKTSGETIRYEPFNQYADQTAADTAWVPVDTAKNRVNITTKVLGFNCVADSSNDSISLDLTTVSDSQWSLRFTLKPTTTTDGANLLWYFGISSADSSSHSGTAQDFIGLAVDYSGANVIGTRDTDGAAPHGAGTDNTLTTPLVDGSPTYLEINRTSTTAYNIKVYRESTYSDVISTISGTCAATTATLRYLKLMNYQGATGAGSMTGSIYDIVFINGTNTFDS